MAKYTKKDSCAATITAMQKAQAVAHKPDHDPLWRINTLPADRYEQTVEMLKRHSPRTVAELLQEDGYHTDIQAVTLSHILERFRSEKIPRSQMLDPYVLGRLTSEVKKQVNVFSELSELIMLQRERIRKAVLMEEESGELLPELNKQIHLQTRLIKVMGDFGIKSNLMNEFIQGFLKESQELDSFVTRETKDMFLRYFMYKLQGGGLEECLVDITNSPAPLE